MDMMIKKKIPALEGTDGDSFAVLSLSYTSFHKHLIAAMRQWQSDFPKDLHMEVLEPLSVKEGEKDKALELEDAEDAWVTFVVWLLTDFPKELRSKDSEPPLPDEGEKDDSLELEDAEKILLWVLCVSVGIMQKKRQRV